MLRGIPFEISPQLLRILAEMGHGDRICIGDAYFPANSMAEKGRIVRADGIDAKTLVNAILTLMPLDNWTDCSVTFMGRPAEDGSLVSSPITEQMTEIIAKYDGKAAESAQYIERFAFYDLAKTSYAVVSSGETENYGCVILQKGTN